MLAVLTIVQVLQFAAAIFFHEPSSVMIKPYEDQDKTDFGFAMAYRSKSDSIVVGAPKVDQIGKVYNCELGDARLTNLISCDEKIIDIDSTDYNTDAFPNQNFYLGSTIATTSDYFFTCAPLMTQIINRNIPDGFGTCFVDNNTDVFRYKGTFEQYLEYPASFPDTRRFSGGTGWSTLLDEKNDLLLIVKTSLSGDIIYVPASKPGIATKSLNSNRYTQLYLMKFVNIGYGVTAGNFFSNSTTVYAFSMTTTSNAGVISFLKYNKNMNLLSLIFNKRKELQIQSLAINSMFGMTMSAADFNMDGMDELLVGAPTQSEEECYECGALHIYIGGDMNSINDMKRLRTILGTTELGRFGSAITAKDIDGDSKPELVVSAPYKDDGHGAVYILSGYEVYHTLFKFEQYKSILLSELKLTQRIEKTLFRTLGFSLQFVSDTDRNGCSELAVGSPGGGQGRVLLFKCVQRINVTLSSKLIGEQIVREQDNSFIVSVCARVELPDLPLNIIGNVTVVNSIIGEATYIPEPEFVIDISCFSCPRDRILCENVTVELKYKEPGDYTFTSKAELQNNLLSNNYSKEFNSSWVVASPYSKFEDILEVPRHCQDDDCDPKLSMELLWSSGKSRLYVLGSSPNETATIKVRNDGNASYEACVWVRVSGAPLTRGNCEDNNGGYRCYLPRPLRRDSEFSINLVLNMTKPSNQDTRLLIEVFLFENCNQNSIDSDQLNITYGLSMDGIYLNMNRDYHILNVTDKQILDNATIYDDHEYIIKNNGSISWKDVEATISIRKEPYVSAFNMSKMDFGECDEGRIEDSQYTYKCILELPPNSTHKLIGTTQIFASDLKPYLGQGKAHPNTTSKISLFLDSRVPRLFGGVTTEIRIQKIIDLSRNKLLISLIAGFLALILLAILIYVLYRCGFFKRKQKQKLLEKKETIRRKSVRRNTLASAVDAPVEGLQMDVDDDPFDDVRPVTTKDNVGLVDEQC